jgi:hypothetical protein
VVSDLPVIKKIYELYKNFYSYSKLFPKKDKYTLGNKCETYILSVLELLIATGSAPKLEKIAYIRKANIKFDTLKIFIRLANEINMLDNKKYMIMQKQIQEIGRMIGGWQKSFN